MQPDGPPAATFHQASLQAPRLTAKQKQPAAPSDSRGKRPKAATVAKDLHAHGALANEAQGYAPQPAQTGATEL